MDTEENQWVNRAGDLWQLGKHRLMCGDSLTMSAVDTLMAGRSADLVFTDPPYNINYIPENRHKSRNRVRKPLGGIKNDNLDLPSFINFIQGAFGMYHHIMHDRASIYAFYSQKFSEVVRSAFKEYFKLSSTLIWVKNNFSLSWADYKWQHEVLLYGWKLRHKWYGDRKQSTVWAYKRDNPNYYIHPTQKPIALARKAILNSSQTGDAVVDLFAGSGSTLMGCEETQRQCYAMDIDPKYVDAIILRWQTATGHEAVLSKGGKSFAAVAARREKKPLRTVSKPRSRRKAVSEDRLAS